MSNEETNRETLDRWRKDPVTFVRECFGVEPDLWQIEVLQAFITNQRVAIKSCKGPGKTCVLAWLTWNFMCTRLYPKIACLSISGDNLRDGLWTELAKWQNKSKFLAENFTWSKTSITCNASPETWWCQARSWAQSADSRQQADTLAGLHEDNIMIVIDEAGSIPQSVMAAADAALSTVGGDKHILMAGNPTRLDGPLYRACNQDRKLWHVTEITSDPDDPKRTPRVSKTWAQQQIDIYGRDNNWTLVNVFGKFPNQASNSLLGPDHISQAMNRKLGVASQLHAAKLIGADPAREGADRGVIIKRQGQWTGTPTITRGLSGHEFADRIINEFFNWQDEVTGVKGADAVLIDTTGGSDIPQMLRDAGIKVIEVVFSSNPLDAMYNNKRSEIWLEMASWIKTGGAMLPKDCPEMVREFTEPIYYYKKDKFCLEAKDDIKKRLGYSPDIADALACTFAQPVQPKNHLTQQWSGAQPKKTFDPFARSRGMITRK